MGASAVPDGHVPALQRVSLGSVPESVVVGDAQVQLGGVAWQRGGLDHGRSVTRCPRVRGYLSPSSGLACPRPRQSEEFVALGPAVPRRAERRLFPLTAHASR